MNGALAWLKDILLTREMALLAVMIVTVGALELLFPLRRIPASHYRFNIVYCFVNQALFTALVGIVAAVVSGVVLGFGFEGLIDLSALGFSGFGGALFALLVSAIVFDFFFYWMHRYQHRSAVLWQEHAVHHSDTAVNVSTGSRSHFIDAVLQPLFISLPMAVLFKLPPLALTWLWMIPFGWTYFVHANIRLNFGPLWWLLVSPDYHRIHHAIDPQHADKNFAVWFPVWDILFGTLSRPAPGFHPETGVAGVSIATVPQALAYPFAAWGRMLRSRFGAGEAPHRQRAKLHRGASGRPKRKP